VFKAVYRTRAKHLQRERMREGEEEGERERERMGTREISRKWEKKRMGDGMREEEEVWVAL
jgi:hypothetical protein